MPTIDDFWKSYQSYSKAVSDIARSLAYSAIAVVWVFKLETSKGDPQLPKALLWPLALAVLTLVADFLQYLYFTILWRVYVRILERRGVAVNADTDEPSWFPLPGEIVFYAKVILIAVCYYQLVGYLYSRLFA